MFVKQNKSHKGTLLTYTIGYRENGKVKHKNIETIGYLDDLKKIYDDPISHFKQIAKDRSNDEINELTIKNLNSKIIDGSSGSKNLGYVILKMIYEDLGIRTFLNNKNKKLKTEYDLNKIFSLLVFSRILYPGSKKETYEGRKRFFEPFDGFSLQDLYRSLDYFSEYKNEIEKLLWENTKDKYDRDTSHLYYDCTNYYFEINYNDEDLVDEEGNIIKKGYRKRGPEKNHRPDPIVEMGLLMDANDIPISYDLFPGNESEKLSLLPITRRTKASCNLGRTIIVADRGLNTSDNIFYLAGRNDHDNMDGYIYGQSVRGADKEFKEWVLNQEGYINTPILNKDGSPEMFRQMIFKDDKFIGYEKKPGIFRHKSRIYPKELTITRDGKRNTKVRTDQKQMVYYSQKYADKQRRDRNQMIERAKDLISNPKKYNRITASGSASYINNIKFDKKTGAVADGLDLSLKLDKIAEEEKYDGYYSIVTSELNISDEELRNKYRGLSKIEESFKITKSEFDARPVYVWTNEHIEAHFLVCFVSLVITRLLEQKTEHKYSLHKMINSMKKYNSINIEHDIYMQNYSDDIIKCFELIFNINLSNKFLTLSKINKNFNF
jgi:transposase